MESSQRSPIHELSMVLETYLKIARNNILTAFVSGAAFLGVLGGVIGAIVASCIPREEEEIKSHLLTQFEANAAGYQKVRRIGGSRFYRPRIVQAQGGDESTKAAEMKKILVNNRGIVIYDHEGNEIETNIQLMNIHEGVLVSHSWDLLGRISKIDIFDSEGGGILASFRENELQVRRLEGRDLVVLRWKRPLPGVVSLVNKLPVEHASRIGYCARLLKMIEQGENGEEIQMRAQELSEGLVYSQEEVVNRLSHPLGTIEVPLSGYYLAHGGKGARGMCGFPIFIMQSETPLVGLHIGQAGMDSVVAPLYKSDFVCNGDSLPESDKLAFTAQLGGEDVPEDWTGVFVGSWTKHSFFQRVKSKILGLFQ